MVMNVNVCIDSYFQLKQPSHDLIIESPSYKILLNHASKLEHTISESGDELPRLRDELVQLRSTRKDWEESILVRPFICSMTLHWTKYITGCSRHIEGGTPVSVRAQRG